MIELSIIIISFNTKNVLRDCINSIFKSVNIQKTEIIVVDNGSNDGSVEQIKNYDSKFKIILIENKTNLGFAKAVNQGIRQARGDYILLLNSDIIVKPNSIKTMIDFAKNNKNVGVVGGKLLNIDGSFQPSVFHFPSVLGAIKEYWFGIKGAYEKYLPKGDNPEEVDAVVGAVMLIPRAVIEKVGLFDEKFFMYFEDLDFCRRVRNDGYTVYYYPRSRYIHYHGISGSKIPQKTNQWLIESSKVYNGLFKYYLVTLVISIGQKFKKIKKYSIFLRIF